MWRSFLMIVVSLLGVSAFAAEPTLAEARLRYLKGNYAESREIFGKLQSSNHVVAAVGLSRCYESEGELGKALSAVDDALKADDKSADLHARRAELLYARGDWDGALASVDRALKLNDEQFAARWVRAQILRDRSEEDAADTEMRWFVRTYVARNRANRDIRDPEELIIVGLAGAENARRHNLTDQFRFILNEVFADALKADANYWPAEFQAGMLLLEKYNKAESLAAFDKALAINPRAAAALVGKGQIALLHFETAEAERLATRALEINPRFTPALILLADVALACNDDRLAVQRLRAALESNPRDEAVLGRLAAVARLRPGLTDSWEDLLHTTEKFNPKPGRFYYEMARRLDERRHYDDARMAYARAIELSPRLTAARTELGMLALRMGEEAEAKKLLQEAFRADPFHVRLSNSLKVLRHLEPYETIRTEHFIVRFDQRLEAVLGRCVVDYVEREYERQAKLFDHRPAGPFLVEVFTNHEMFSGRIIAAPDLHTVGATTGRTFALTSPKAKEIRRPFNWARVVRHELTHIFNLDQTKFLVPHWLTEGLAVRNEGFDRPAEWLRVLAGRAAKNDLLNLSNLDAGFIRPRSPDEWTLAYCQANLYVDFLTENYGADVTAKLLRAFRDGAETPSAIEQATGQKIATVEQGYRPFVDQLLKSVGAQPAEPLMTLAQLEAAHQKNPNDVTINARLADQYLRRKRSREARECVEAALTVEPKNSLALTVKALLRIEAGDDDGALPLLQSAAEADPPNLRALRLLGQLHSREGRFEEALGLFERGHKLEAIEPSWLEEIAKAAKQAGEVERSIRATMDWLAGDPDALDQRRDLAQTLLELDRFAEAERYAREALEIDPTDSTCQDALLQALEKQSKKDELARWKRLLGRG
ncbi:MAG: tetratricopeptide repeat protein [Gemmataceae bacterium]